MVKGHRTYTKVRRAEAEGKTRDRIIEAMIALHEEVGPSRTTISAIAERAGVERLTVYRHFPDEPAMLRACSSRWAEIDPPPAIPVKRYRDPAAGFRAMLLPLYEWYRRNHRMLANVTADLDRVPAVREVFATTHARLMEMTAAMDGLWPRRNERRLATIRHAAAFATWRSLDQWTGSDRKSVTLVLEWIRGLR